MPRSTPMRGEQVCELHPLACKEEFLHCECLPLYGHDLPQALHLASEAVGRDAFLVDEEALLELAALGVEDGVEGGAGKKRRLGRGGRAGGETGRGEGGGGGGPCGGGDGDGPRGGGEGHYAGGGRLGGVRAAAVVH